MPRLPLHVFVFVLAMGLITLSSKPAVADTAGDAQELVNKATATFDDFRQDPDMTWFRNHVGQAKGIMIAPKIIQAGFIFGGSGGRSVLLARTEAGQWTGPAFYNMGSASVGFQAGADVSQIVMLIMTQKGLDAFLSTEVKLGTDISVSAGPVGAGAGAATSDVLAYSRSKGLYGGINLSGSVISPNGDYNTAYYGQNATPVNILIQHKVSNKNAEGLMSTVKQAAQQK
jgi:lipid-binding SYLF domain-containing protein